MNRPEPGLSLQCRCVRVCDGDTVVVGFHRLPYEIKVRLIDVWAPELNERGGLDARNWLQNKLWASEDDLLVHVPIPKHHPNPLSHLTFDRVPAYLWAGDENLNEAIVAAGHATKNKKK